MKVNDNEIYPKRDKLHFFPHFHSAPWAELTLSANIWCHMPQVSKGKDAKFSRDFSLSKLYDTVLPDRTSTPMLTHGHNLTL